MIFSVLIICFNCCFRFSLFFNFVRLSWPGTQRFNIEIVVSIEETIVNNVCATKWQRIDHIVKYRRKH